MVQEAQNKGLNFLNLKEGISENNRSAAATINGVQEILLIVPVAELLKSVIRNLSNQYGL